MCSIIGYCGAGGDLAKIKAALAYTASRGPDDSRIVDTGAGFLGFNRLSIMGLSPAGMQPFELGARRTGNTGADINFAHSMRRIGGGRRWKMC